MENTREDVNPEEGLKPPVIETPDDDIVGDCEVDDDQPEQVISEKTRKALLAEWLV